MNTQKRILVVPVGKTDEALRMACGLTLLDDRVAVMSWTTLVRTADTDEQLQALDFADVPVQCLDRSYDGLAKAILDCDVVYCV